MRFKIITSILVLVIASFAVSGSTVAFFTSGSNVSNEFTAGTVKISVPEPTETGWMPGDDPGEECKTIEWSIINDGTKSAYVRVKPIVDITFTGNGTSGPFEAWLNGAGQNYFPYIKGNHTAATPLKVLLIQGTNQIGYADIYDDGNNLYMYFKLVGCYKMDQTYINSGLEEKGNQSALQQFPHKITHDPWVNQYLFSTSYVHEGLVPGNKKRVTFSTILNGTAIYLEAYAQVYITYSEDSAWWYVPELYSQHWIFKDDWWYYPAIVEPGNTVNFGVKVCKFECFDGNISLYLDAEAVQATHGAKDYEWAGNPLGEP